MRFAHENGGRTRGLSRANVQSLELRAANACERNRESRSLSIKSLKRSFVASDGTMDKTRIRDDEWRRCHLQRAMMHSHGRCIKEVYAREARGASTFAGCTVPRRATTRRVIKVVKRV